MVVEAVSRVQVAGAVLAAAAVGLLGLAYVLEPRWATGLGAAMLAELVTGREAAIPLALVAGTPAWLVGTTSIVQNLAVAALVVPLAARSLDAAARRDSFSARFLRGLHEEAAARLPRGRSAWALFAFMLVPFVANGPVLAGLIGVMAGVPTRRLVAAVVPAVVITATAWTYAYVALTDVLARVDERLALGPAILAAVLVLYWAGAAVRRARQAGSSRASP